MYKIKSSYKYVFASWYIIIDQKLTVLGGNILDHT